MDIDLMHFLSMGGAAALSVAALHAVRESMIRAELRRMKRRDGDCSGSTGPRAGGGNPAGGGTAGKPAAGSGDAEAEPSLEAGKQDAPAPEGGSSADPGRQEDQARRRIAYHLIAILAVMIFSLLAMVAFGVISVDDIDKFGVIVGPVVTLVTAATSSYFADRRGRK